MNQKRAALYDKCVYRVYLLLPAATENDVLSLVKGTSSERWVDNVVFPNFNVTL